MNQNAISAEMAAGATGNPDRSAKAFARRLRAIIERAIRERKRKQAARELYDLDDRTLKDIGVHRNEILSLTRELYNDRGSVHPRSRRHAT